MNNGAAFLDPHVVPSPKNLAVCGDKGGADWDSSFSCALFRFSKGGFEAWVTFHGGSLKARHRGSKLYRGFYGPAKVYRNHGS